MSLVCSSSSHVLRTFPPPSNLPENGNCKEIISRKDRGATPVRHPFGDKFVRKWVQPLFVIHLVTRGAGGMPPDWRQEPCRCKPKAGPQMARGRHTKQSAATCVRFIQPVPDANPAPHVGCHRHPHAPPAPTPCAPVAAHGWPCAATGRAPAASGRSVSRALSHTGPGPPLRPSSGLSRPARPLRGRRRATGRVLRADAAASPCGAMVAGCAPCCAMQGQAAQCAVLRSLAWLAAARPACLPALVLGSWPRAL